MECLRICLALVAVLSVVYAVDWDTQTDLDVYVHSDDGYYSWEILAEYRYNICTMYVVNMTSQKWQDESYVDHPVWWHYMGVAVPDQVNLTYPDAGFMFIDGGSNNPYTDPPEEDDDENRLVCLAASDMGVVGGYLKAIPNQPLVFTNDPTQRSRKEDSVIAWTWRTYIDDPTPDPTVILRMPMTKAAKRGLDTIAAVAAQQAPWTNVSRFMVTGASKRGWTTWSLSATDKRVIAAAPLVFSLLNFNQSLMAHYQAMGGAWSFAFESYYRENLTQELLNPKAQGAFAIEDMYTYKERLTLPILQIVSTGDEFFLCQDSLYWWNDIPDPKWTYQMENAEHSMFPHYVKMYDTAVGWYGAILAKEFIPTTTWTLGETADEGYIELTTDATPEEITVFRAVTLGNDTRNNNENYAEFSGRSRQRWSGCADTRDYRLAGGSSQDDFYFHPVIWDERNFTLTELSTNHWRATVNKVEGEWVGFLIRTMYRSEAGNRLFFTTQTNIVPNTFPVLPCFDADSCYSIMV